MYGHFLLYSMFFQRPRMNSFILVVFSGRVPLSLHLIQRDIDEREKNERKKIKLIKKLRIRSN